MWTDNVQGVAGLPGDAARVVTNQGEPGASRRNTSDDLEGQGAYFKNNQTTKQINNFYLDQ